jgi:hypothetical protein
MTGMMTSELIKYTKREARSEKREARIKK